MGLPRGRVRPLLGAMLLLLLRGECSGAASHCLRYFYTEVSAPGQGLPAFSTVAFLDAKPLFHYNSDRRRVLPGVPWLGEALRAAPQFWDLQTQVFEGAEAKFRAGLENLQQTFNQSGGPHTWQAIAGCESRGDGTSKGYLQFGYDGRDFIAFDKETLTWTAADGPAQAAKRKLDAEAGSNLHRKAYLEETCMEVLRQFPDLVRETLLRTERPVVTVTRKDSHEGSETLLCRAHGFYPKEIDATWRRDGEARQGDTFRGVVSPNADGTYYTWLSITIDPQERSHYQCHVEPLDVAVERAGPFGLLAGAVVAVVLLVLLVLAVAGIVIGIKKCQERDLLRSHECLVALGNP